MGFVCLSLGAFTSVCNASYLNAAHTLQVTRASHVAKRVWLLLGTQSCHSSSRQRLQQHPCNVTPEVPNEEKGRDQPCTSVLYRVQRQPCFLLVSGPGVQVSSMIATVIEHSKPTSGHRLHPLSSRLPTGDPHPASQVCCIPDSSCTVP